MQGRFQPVLGDPAVDPAEVTRLVLCTGKIYYDLAAYRKAHDRKELGPAINLAAGFDRKIVVEQGVGGRRLAELLEARN